MPEHGGNRAEVSLQFGIPENQWLDLSTGINPHGWSVPEIPAECWQRLPEEHDGLIEAASDYYEVPAEYLLPLAGTQAAIQRLPSLRPSGRVAILSPAYNEHRHNWSRAGHDVTGIGSAQIDAVLPETDVLVLVNPNNPTAEAFAPEQLKAWHEKLAARGGWLVIDEAYTDCTPELSLSPICGIPGLIVLRSLGKFFGLAGIRVGFMLAEKQLLIKMAEELGPWHLTNPSRWITRQALLDKEWQIQTRFRLLTEGKQLNQLLHKLGYRCQSGPLFSWFRHPSAAEIYRQLAQQGILVRYFKDHSSLRIGLPDNNSEWQRLEQGLQKISL